VQLGHRLGSDSQLPSKPLILARCRCSYVSFSALGRDCSWYATCNMRDLRRPPTSAPDYVTLRVKPPAKVNSTKPLLDTAPRLAIVTMASGSHKCALVQWCERVRLFVDALKVHVGFKADVLVISPAGEDERADCPFATFIGLDWRVAVAMKACRARASDHPAQHSNLAGTDPVMQKLLVLNLVRYDFVLFADADVDLLPEETLPREAAEHVARLIAQPSYSWRHSRSHAPMESAAVMDLATRGEPWWEFAGNADSSSPVNAGLFLVRPSAALFKQALEVLSYCRFTTTHGWDYVGRPRALTFNILHPDGEVGRADTRDGEIVNNPNATDAIRWNKWSFAGADIDQGILWHLFYLRRRRAADRIPSSLQHASASAH
jgi:hypothetical protein